jgi:predicted ATPase
LLGREGEAAAIEKLIGQDHVRILTLLGPGGVGKTRLAVQVARELAHDYADGVAFVPLAPLREPSLVAVTIAQATSAPDSGDDTTVERLIKMLRPRHMLLVLDNFEHLLEAAPIVSDLLTQCPGLDVLATSRSPLRINGERIFAVPTLPVPAENQVATPEDALEFPSVALFVERAQAARHDFRLTGEILESVLAISRRLDGLPLALELAGAWVSVLPPAALLVRLRQHVHVLTGGPRDAPARHRALTDAIAWSHDLLAPEHQQLFRRLSVFAGGWTLAAAEHLGVGPDATTSVLDGLTALVSQSLVHVKTDLAGEPRFGFLETIRAHARGRLERNGEGHEAGARHAEIFVKLAEEAEWHLTGPERTSWLQRLDTELDNCRAALAWSLADRGDPELGQRLVGSLSWFWYFRGRLNEGRAWAEALTLRSAHTPAESRARALFALGGMALMQGDTSNARSALEKSVCLFRNSRDKRRLALAVGFLGMAAHTMGASGAAFELHQEAIELAVAGGNRWLQALALTSQGAASKRLGDLDTAESLYQSSLSLFRELEDAWGYSIALRGIAGLMFDKGEHGCSRALYERSVPMFRRAGDTRGLAQTLLGLGRSALHDGAAQSAREAFAESLARWKEIDITGGVIRAIVGLAGVANAVADPERAVMLYAAADTLAPHHGVSLSASDASHRARSLATICQKLGLSRFEAVWFSGCSLTLDEAVASALA